LERLAKEQALEEKDRAIEREGLALKQKEQAREGEAKALKEIEVLRRKLKEAGLDDDGK
ncbi:MAG: hypothetical protein JKY24_08675, partial [Pseudomonadales bacterium]|nr:hypothetical protein [Pseudomonadales bacterium]